MEYKMLKVDKETHNAVLKYISKRHLETDYKMTVSEAIRELLDIACNGKGRKMPTHNHVSEAKEVKRW